jgi:hypothetical protein
LRIGCAGPFHEAKKLVEAQSRLGWIGLETRLAAIDGLSKV